MARKPGRPKTGDLTLTRERILDAAMQLIDSGGVEALSMRRLAAEMGVDPMAIYHHIPNKQALLNGLIEGIFQAFSKAVPLEEMNIAAWQAQLQTFAFAYRRMARQHPNLTLYLISSTDWAVENGLAINEWLYSILKRSGLPSRLILQVGNTLIDFLNGFVLGEQGAELGQPGELGGMVDVLTRFPPDAFPVTREVFAAMTHDDMTADFAAGVGLIIAGIEQWTAQNRKA